MSELLRKHYEKLLLGVGLVLLATSSAWTWTQRPSVGAPRRHRGSWAAPGPMDRLVARPEPRHTPAAWTAPAAQSGGADWVYEVFTPPVIYYNPVAKSFTATPPRDQAAMPAPAAEPVFGVILMAVKLEPYRLQLVGYFGTPGDYTGMFVSPQVTETLLARPGRRFEQLGLLVKDVTVARVSVEHDDPWPVYDITARAVLLDERSGAEVALDSRTRKLSDTPLAVLSLGKRKTEVRELHVGDAWRDDRVVYRVDRIQLDPPEVAVARLAPDRPLPETYVLRPSAAHEEVARQDSGGEQQLATPLRSGLASADTAKESQR